MSPRTLPAPLWRPTMPDAPSASLIERACPCGEDHPPVGPISAAALAVPAHDEHRPTHTSAGWHVCPQCESSWPCHRALWVHHQSLAAALEASYAEQTRLRE